jgi:hypothetical protein
MGPNDLVLRREQALIWDKSRWQASPSIEAEIPYDLHATASGT